MHKYYGHPVLPISAELDAHSQESNTVYNIIGQKIKRLPMNSDKLRTYPLPSPGSEKAEKEDQEFIVQESQSKLTKIPPTELDFKKSQSY